MTFDVSIIFTENSKENCLIYFKITFCVLHMMYVNIYIQNLVASCKCSYNLIDFNFTPFVENFQIRETGICHGDSGGPLIIQDKSSIPYRHIQVGIVQGALACGSKEFPGIYARIDHPEVWNFINDTINNRRGNQIVIIWLPF